MILFIYAYEHTCQHTHTHTYAWVAPGLKKSGWGRLRDSVAPGFWCTERNALCSKLPRTRGSDDRTIR